MTQNRPPETTPKPGTTPEPPENLGANTPTAPKTGTSKKGSAETDAAPAAEKKDKAKGPAPELAENLSEFAKTRMNTFNTMAEWASSDPAPTPSGTSTKRAPAGGAGPSDPSVKKAAQAKQTTQAANTTAAAVEKGAEVKHENTEAAAAEAAAETAEPGAEVPGKTNEAQPVAVDPVEGVALAPQPDSKTPTEMAMDRLTALADHFKEKKAASEAPAPGEDQAPAARGQNRSGS